jgi:ParB/RepB/Spo0J family partition protein
MARKADKETELILEGLSVPPPKRMVIPVACIRHTQRNPRGVGADDEEDLGGLVASLESTPEPDLVQAPAVQQVGPDDYIVIYGDRRVRAVKLAGWAMVSCDVYVRLDPLAAHDRGLLENLQRKDVHPLDEADAIGIAWLMDNARALGLHDDAAQILAIDQPQSATITQLTALLIEAGWARSRPKVTQMATLKRLGLTMNKASLKKLMRLLSLSEEVKAIARQTDLTAAALRALGTLGEEDQLALVIAIKEDPSLAAKVRRIARKVNERGYPLERALSEARGQVWMGPQSTNSDADGDAGDLDDEDESDERARAPGAAPGNGVAGESAGISPGGDRKAQSDAAMKLLEVAGSLTEAIATLRTALNGQPIGEMPPPWNEIVIESLDLMNQELATLDVPVAHPARPNRIAA